MDPRRYVICDIEATGLDEDKEIIEIALITVAGGRVVEVWDSYVNPLRPVSSFIQELTAISLRQLEEAPKFYDLADAIRLRLEGAIFVSHNTDFDFQLLRKKFEELGQELRLKTFCTLKVAQETIPGLRSYNLDALCAFFSIKIHDRHSALGDARATLELFKELQGLRHRERPRVLFLPQHQKVLESIPGRAGLLRLRGKGAELLRCEPALDLRRRAQELLEIRPENRALLKSTIEVQWELTGSVLIAEFQRLEEAPFRARWMIAVAERTPGQKSLELRRFSRSLKGIEYFTTYSEAKRELRRLERFLAPERFAYRDSGPSKEEVFRRNQKIMILLKEASFPNDSLLILGEGRTMGERSVVLVRGGHVLGYGLTSAGTQAIESAPERFLQVRFSRDPGADLVAKRHLRMLKNMKHKTDSWRGISERTQ